MRTLGKMLLAAVLAVAGVAGFGGPAEAATPPSGTNWAALYNPLLPRVDNWYHVCLDVPGGTTRTGAVLGVYHCHSTDSEGAVQRWRFTRLSNDTYWIFNQSNLMCVTAVRKEGPPDWIVQLPCNTADGQAWRLVDFQPGVSFQIRNDSPNFSNICIETVANSNDSHVAGRPCAVHAFQIWAFG